MADGSRLTEWGRHVRAGLVLTGSDIDALAVELNMSRKTLERTMRGERTPRDWETRRIAEVLSLPDWFIAEGLNGHGRDDADALSAKLEQLGDVLTGIAADVAEMKRRQEGGL